MTTKPLKIFMLARGYPTKEYPMNGIFEFDQAKALADLGHEVTFGALDLRSVKNKRPLGFESLKKDGVNIVALNLPIGNIFKKVTHRIRIQGFKKLYQKMVKAHGKPSMVHVQFINLGNAATKVLKNRDFPLIYTEHHSGFNQPDISPHLKRLGDETYPTVDAFLAVSKYLGKNLKRHFGIMPKVIPNIVDVESFQYEKQYEKKASHDPSDTEEFHFISVGRLQKGKEYHLLINAFGDAFLNRPQIKLYIYGGGPEKESLKALIKDLNLESQVFLMGQQPRKDIAKAMKNAQAFVLASKLETFGVAFIEAMAAGLPVISLAKGGPEGFIHTKNGSLLPEGTKEDLRTAMIQMVKEIEAYDKIAISKEMKEMFAPEKIAEDLVAVYNECRKNDR